MAQPSFYLASGTAAAAWITCYGLAAYSFGEAFASLASPVAISLSVAAALIVLALPALILQYEKRLLVKAEHGLPERALVAQPAASTHGGEVAPAHAASPRRLGITPNAA